MKYLMILFLFSTSFAWADSFDSRRRLSDSIEAQSHPRRTFIRSITKNAVSRLSEKYKLSFSPLNCKYDGRGETCDFTSNRGDLCRSWVYLELMMSTGQYTGIVGATVECYSRGGQKKIIKFDQKAPRTVLSP